MGIIANIYRSDMGDCSNLGLSSNCTEVTVVNVKGPFEPSKDRPAVELVKGYVEGSCLVRPVSLRGEHSFMGGTFISTSDSRFSTKVREITGGEFASSYGAVPFHDRVEL